MRHIVFLIATLFSTLTYSQSSIRFLTGDVNCDDVVDVKDITELVEILNSRSKAKVAVRADVNADGNVNSSDVDSIGRIIDGEWTETQTDYSNALTISCRVPALQNASGTQVVLTQASLSVGGKSYTIPVSDLDPQDFMTTIRVNTNMYNVSRISVYAGGTIISGNMTVRTLRNTATITNPTTQPKYATKTAEDAVTVVGGEGRTRTAFLAPVGLTSGITIAVQTEDGKTYTQKFNNIQPGQVNNLEFTETTPSGAWMASIPGNTYFNHITLPGAHDAATKGCIQGTTETQSLSIADQLKAGVRALDLRPYASDNTTADNMYIYHGSAKTSYLFRTALDEIVSYLKANPTETVFVLIHEEDDKNRESWRSAILTCLTNVKAYIKSPTSNMTLKDCRGKMVIISRDNVGSTTLCGKCGWGSSFNDKTVFQGQDGGSTTGWTLVYQDEYEYKSDYATSRIANVEKLLTGYIQPNETNANRIYFNSTNVAYRLLTSASQITKTAKAVNEAILNSTTFQNSTGRWGIISSDYIGDSRYSGDKLLKMIIDHNYKYLFQGRE